MSDVSSSAGTDVAEPTDTSIAPDATTRGGADVREIITGLNVGQDASFYSTISAGSFAEKMALTKAINDSTPVDEALGEQFNLANYIVQAVDIIDGQSGELVTAPRVTLISDEGKAYHGTSKGLLTSIRNLEATVGAPTNWEGETIPVKVVMKGTRPRQYFTVEFV